ncbi:4441_t:CDS:2, partial [Cetraspora pellucida]
LPYEAIGTKFRADTKFIQIFFEKTSEADNFIKQGNLQVQDTNIPIIPPRGKLPPLALIRLENVPIRGRKYLENLITDTMASKAEVESAAGGILVDVGLGRVKLDWVFSQLNVSKALWNLGDGAVSEKVEEKDGGAINGKTPRM